MSADSACREVRDMIAELALGITTGDERARALEHLARCPRCRRALDDMADVVDELLLLAPAREPPAGFETRVLERLAPGGRRRSRVGIVATVAAVLAGVLAAVAVLEAGGGDRYRIEVIRDGRSAVLGSMHGTRTWGGDLGGDLHGVDAVRLEGRDGEEFV